MGFLRTLGKRAERLKRDVAAAAEDEVECPSCGAAVQPAYDECPACGAALED